MDSNAHSSLFGNETNDRGELLEDFREDFRINNKLPSLK